MALECPDPATSVVITTSGTSQTYSVSMTPLEMWMFTANTSGCWITQAAATPTATAGSGSVFVAAGTTMLIDGNAGAKLAVIQDSATSKAVLVRIRRL